MRVRHGAAAILVAAAFVLSGVACAGDAMSVDPPTVVQGSWAVVRLAGGEGPGRIEAGGRRIPLFPVPGGWRALVPVAVDAATGRITLRARLRDGDRTARLTVVRRPALPRVTLKGINVSPESLAALAANHESVVAFLAQATPVAWWSGPLRRPVEGVVTSPYGPTRGYGDGVEMAHKGVDFASGAGMPVVAAAAGTVAVARRMKMYGNCVVIDHGQTVHSSYLHMTALAVRAGDRVEAGQVVGTAGATGMAKGAHLHFGTSIGTVAVDPSEMLARGLPE